MRADGDVAPLALLLDFASENVQRKTHFIIQLWAGRFTHAPGSGIKINITLKLKVNCF
jgi:hypothetical protein